MIRIRPLSTVLATLALATVLGACGSSGSGAAGSGSGTGTGSSSGHNVTIKNFTFTPASLTVKVGTKVTFTNEDGVTHTATSSGAKTFDSGNLAKGQSYTYTFTKAGTYSYICTIHPYMKGTVIVQ